MNDENCCGKCCWRKDIGDNYRTGYCRIRAPQVIPKTYTMAGPRGSANITTEFCTVWPKVNYDDFCGEFCLKIIQEQMKKAGE